MLHTMLIKLGLSLFQWLPLERIVAESAHRRYPAHHAVQKDRKTALCSRSGLTTPISEI